MFVLAHLSDPHLSPLPTPRLRELTGKRLLGYLNWRRSRRDEHRPEALDAIVHDLIARTPDHIAVTGDLVNISLPGEFASARQWLENLGPPRDVTVVPGNHDAYVRAAIGLSTRHWDDAMRADDDAASGFPFVRKRGPVALVGLSTALPTGPFLATGKLGSEQLTRLADTLGRLRGLFRIVLIHHPPVSPLSARLRRLVDAAQFRDVIAARGAELVLHGHSHVRSLVWLNGPNGRVPAVGVPSASAPLNSHRDPGGYNLYRIDGDSSGWRCEMIARGLRRDHAGIGELGRVALAG